ncbi:MULTISPECIES: hypothetical protein [unclassified Rhizobium]|uniref:hypothetical protein n=1 Tax=unclassified Rhizobium TaxID=2613769 RepID=UPI001C83F3C2|nr:MULTISPECIES: hypothetical protein [unclassified Rhizobium]MBX5219613.1 hypothetical protein [Rhizobium sp. NLR8a]MBX5225104.1 hypothetical protein [Rhizobium sp. NLR9b]MBX5237689.1 hypothetical protein [Rhizobium sp. NLR22b]MBX5285776.1 hypothetical protein [Rhizobium sp. NLR10b]
MEKHIVKADGNGAIDVNGQVSPVTYTVSVKEGKGHSYEVDIRLMAPRDWLLQRGFNRDAVLVSQSGARIPVYHDGANHHDGGSHHDDDHHDGGRLDPGDTISIVLTARDDSCTSEVDLMRKYPEFDGAG